jgi:Spy/CpxP family protein refolding chaperone
MTPRHHPTGARASALALAACLAALTAACDRAPGDARDWTAADHDQPPEANQAPQPGRGGRGSQGQQPPGGETDLVDVAWQRNCMECHGRIGHGDGPKGMGVRAPDLTRPEWQAQVTDAQITEVIRKGRGKMPAFASLPAPIVDGLVKRVRATRGAK